MRPEVHLAALVVEHLVCDAWSMDRLIADLGVLYLKHSTREERPELPPSGPSYAAFAQRENEYLASPEGLRDIDAALAAIEPLGVLPEVKLPGFTGRQDIDYNRQGRLVGRIEADEAKRLTLFGRKAGMRLGALLAAAMHVALAELSGDAHVGTPVVTSNRRRPEDFGVVGWLATKFVLTSEPLAYAEGDYLRHFRDRFYMALRAPAVSWQRLLFEQYPHVFGNFSTTPIVTFNAVDRSTSKRGSAFVGLTVEELAVRLGGRDNSIMADWAISQGVDVSLDFKSDWYSYDDINMLWSATRDVHRRWLSGE
ncbi:condensation domain-containing protein [Micromonospora chersina]|uniref:condensation domain-containing protein n=1 Tax=Micromonospora chersina TaxID=47854 RepID=UPI003677E568